MYVLPCENRRLTFPKIPCLDDPGNRRIVDSHYLRGVLKSLNCDIGGTSVSNLVSHGVGHRDRFGNDLKKVEQSSSRPIDERGRVDSRKLSHDLSRA